MSRARCPSMVTTFQSSPEKRQAHSKYRPDKEHCWTWNGTSSTHRHSKSSLAHLQLRFSREISFLKPQTRARPVRYGGVHSTKKIQVLGAARSRSFRVSCFFFRDAFTQINKSDALSRLRLLRCQQWMTFRARATSVPKFVKVTKFNWDHAQLSNFFALGHLISSSILGRDLFENFSSQI